MDHGDLAAAWASGGADESPQGGALSISSGALAAWTGNLIAVMIEAEDGGVASDQ